MLVVLENGDYFSYQNPSESVCIEFAGCPGWNKAQSVSWRNLPAHWSVDFYQQDGCGGVTDGDVYSWTENEAGDGMQTFKTPKAIRSIYARPLWGSIPWSVAHKCVKPRKKAKRAEATSLNGSDGGDDDVNSTELTVVGSVDEDTSSNWGGLIETKPYTILNYALQ
ncbi:uncharacterized protein IUM83_13434 [Phytophthora cinnamomi]|uniref:uncharacterized protein n=1 Tax=Phytophthora cinnamomi TaxID=4785 RepID=UPI0035598FE1|nr:hypothetical protein IUM83_13434 [Phytophthora cinnamomi]